MPLRPGIWFYHARYDGARNQLVIFGGVDGQSYLGDTWVFDGSAWSSPVLTQSPSPRQAPQIAYDPVLSQLLLFGGRFNTGTKYNDTWLLKMEPQLLSLAPASVWVGLKNSDDQGTQFDLRAEFFKNGALITSGQTLCITGVTRNPNLAKQVSVAFAPFPGVAMSPGDSLSIRFLTRIGTNPDGTKCAGPGGSHSNAVGLRLYYDGSTRNSGFGAESTGPSVMSYFLHSNTTLDYFDATAPVASTAKFKDSAAINFGGGNAWKMIGNWQMTVTP